MSKLKVTARMMSLQTPRAVAGAATLKLGTKACDSQEPGILDGNLTLWVTDRAWFERIFATGKEFLVEITPIGDGDALPLATAETSVDDALEECGVTAFT